MNYWHYIDQSAIRRRRLYYSRPPRSVFDDPFYYYYYNPARRMRQTYRWYGIQPPYYTLRWWW